MFYKIFLVFTWGCAVLKLTFRSSRGKDELAKLQQSNDVKIYLLILIAIAALGVGLIELIAPNFFNYPYWNMNVRVNDVLRFYPLFLVGFAWAMISAFTSSPTGLDGRILLTEVFNYSLTGLWEELAFRCVLVPYAMIAIVISNWFFSIGVGYIVGACLVFYALKLLFGYGRNFVRLMLALLLFAIAGFFFWIGSSTDPIFWIFREVLLPIANFATFEQMEPILLGAKTPLFLYGIFWVNSWFRDGHKNQGAVGWINSWYIGMVLIYITMTYGIMTAIVIHALYDIIFAVMKFVMRKVFAVMNIT